MNGTGGDHELDVAGILRRAREPDHLSDLRRAIEKLAEERSTAWIADLLQDMRTQLRTMANAVEALASQSGAPGSDHLVDTTAMESFTEEIVIEPGTTTRYTVGLSRSTFFAADAVAMDVRDAYNREIFRCATVLKVESNCLRLLYSQIDASRWAAPPGRGHRAGWLFTCPALRQCLDFEIRNDSPDCTIVVLLTLSGYPLCAPPPGVMLGRYEPSERIRALFRQGYR